MTPAFWRDRRVLVTGHTGFKGGWLVMMLRRLGARVTGLALAPDTVPDLFALAAVGDDCTSCIADVRDAEAVAAIVRRIRPEVVMHLAAQPLVRASYARATETWSTNVMGTLHVLDACRAIDDVRAIVVVTTDKCYEHVGKATRPFREGDALGGHDPYSSSKAAVEIAVSSWRRSFFDAPRCGVATARAGNVLGGGDWSADRLVPDLVRSAASGVPVALRSPHATRPWQHVLDPLDGYLRLAQALHATPAAFSEAWNFGPCVSSAWSVVDVASAFVAALDRGARWTIAGDASLHEAADLVLDSAKAATRLAWTPRLSTGEAIAMAADGYRAVFDGASLRAVIDAQIAARLTELDDEVTA